MHTEGALDKFQLYSPLWFSGDRVSNVHASCIALNAQKNSHRPDAKTCTSTCRFLNRIFHTCTRINCLAHIHLSQATIITGFSCNKCSDSPTWFSSLVFPVTRNDAWTWESDISVSATISTCISWRQRRVIPSFRLRIVKRLSLWSGDRHENDGETDKQGKRMKNVRSRTFPEKAVQHFVMKTTCRFFCLWSVSRLAVETNDHFLEGMEGRRSELAWLFSLFSPRNLFLLYFSFGVFLSSFGCEHRFW